jgi:membrane protein DedA with SNARE-associated domain
MAKVSIWAQWLGVAAGVLLSSVFAVFLGWFIGWSHFRRLWGRRKVPPGQVRRAGAAPRG